MAALRELAGGRADLRAEGASEGELHQPLARQAAELCGKAGARPGDDTKVDRRGAQAEGCRSPFSGGLHGGGVPRAPVLREVHRERGMRVCFFVEEPAGRDLPGAGDLMARREITEAGQQRLDRYKQRRDEYLRKLAHLAPPLSGEQKARLAVLLAPAVEEYRRRKTP